ncbi:MAG: hypothetical protein ABI702_22045 [Burkholderiales bacterium]
MAKMLTPLVHPGVARSLQSAYVSLFGERSADPSQDHDRALQDFIAATTAVKRKPMQGQGNAFQTTEWLCTQWPDTSFDPAAP